MLDRQARKIIDPLLVRIAGWCLKIGLSADRLTGIGFIFGIAAIVAIANRAYEGGLLFILLNRICDGLDGAAGRLAGPTDAGGYLDIVFDFLIYGGFVFAFALADPKNAVAASFLLFSFIGTGTTFLAFAIFAAKHKLHPLDQGSRKAFVYLGGLTEGTETILLFLFLCVEPSYFSPAAYFFGALCWVTVLSRIYAALVALKGPRDIKAPLS